MQVISTATGTYWNIFFFWLNITLFMLDIAVNMTLLASHQLPLFTCQHLVYIDKDALLSFNYVYVEFMFYLWWSPKINAYKWVRDTSFHDKVGQFIDCRLNWLDLYFVSSPYSLSKENHWEVYFILYLLSTAVVDIWMLVDMFSTIFSSN